MGTAIIRNSASLDSNSNQQISSLKVPKGGSVTLYSQANYQGISQIYTSDSTDLGSWNNLASSIRFTGIATFYKNTGLAGESLQLSSDAASLDSSWNDQISSFIAPTGGSVTLYSEANYQGIFEIFAGYSNNLNGWSDLASSIKFNDPGIAYLYTSYNWAGNLKACASNVAALDATFNNKIRSLRVPTGGSVTLYSEANYQGISKIFTSDSSNLGGWTDLASSIRFTGIAYLYKNTGWAGEYMQLSSDAASLDSSWNDQISSLRVPIGGSVTLYTEANYQGTSQIFANHSSDLGSWSDVVSSIRFNDPGMAYFYKLLNYYGQVLPLLSNAASLDSSWNDQVRSLKVPIAGSRLATVTLYQGANYQGYSQIYTSDINNIGGMLPSSIKVNDPDIAFFYKAVNYGGDVFPYASDLSSFGDIPTWNAQISSLKVPIGGSVTLYTEANYQGTFQIFTSDTSNLGIWSDVASSIRFTGIAYLYKDFNYGGESKQLTGDIASLDSNSNQQISSLKVPKGGSVTLYSQVNYTGISQIFTSDSSNLGGWDNLASSIRFNDPGIAYFYQDNNYAGGCIALTSDAASLAAWDDQISSLRVPKGGAVTLYTEPNYSGASLIVTSDSTDLGGWSNVVSSIRFTGIAYLYIDIDYGGQRLQLTGDAASLDSSWNDQISSLRVPIGGSVTLYTEANYQGTSQIFSNPSSNLGNWSNVVSSIRFNDPGVAYFYKALNWSGESLPLTSDAASLAAWDDQISSLRVPKGGAVTLYTEPNYSGASLIVTSDSTDLGGWSNVVSSIRFTGIAYLYIDIDYGGQRLQLTGDAASLDSSWNDQISSLRVPIGGSVTLYTEANYQGTSQVFSNPSRHLGNWSDMVSSIRFNDPGVAYFYKALNWSGESLPLTSNAASLDSNWNQQISSLKVPRGGNVTLYSQPNYSGISQIFTSDSSNLGDWSGRASSIRINDPAAPG
eukprot:g70131.t1